MNSNNRPSPQCGSEGQLSASQFQFHASVNSQLMREDLEEALCRTTAELEGYRALYENAPLIYFILDLTGKVLSLNRYGATRLGYAVSELIEQPVFVTFHPEDRAALTAAFLDFVQRVPVEPQWEFRQVTKAGSLLWVRITVRILQGADNAPIALFVCEDITNRRQAEARLHLLEQAIEGTCNSVVIADATQPDLPVIYVNPSFERMTGYTAAEAIGRNCRFLQGTDTDQSALATLRSALRDGKPCRVVLRNYRKDGSLFWNELHVAPMFGAAGQLTSFVGVQNDVSEAKRNEAMLRQQAERERWVAAMTKLSAGIAQRIRRSLDLNDILNTTVQEVRQFLNADRVVIYQFQPDWSGVIAVESVGEGWRSILGMTITDSFFNSVAGRDLYKQGRVQAIDDVLTAGLSKCHEDLLTRLQIRANLVVPILQQSATAVDAGTDSREHLWGLLVAHHCATPRQWQLLEIDLLGQLATQVGIAIQQAELYQQVQQLNAELEQQVHDRTQQLQQALNFEALLKRITDKVRDTLDENHILQSAVRELSLGLGIDRCNAALYDLEQQTAIVRYEHATTSLPTIEGRVMPMSSAPGIYPQLLQGQCFQFCQRRSRRGWLTVLVCPLFDDQGTLGDLWLFKPKDQTFRDLEIRLVQQVANQCAIAIRQARLHEAAHHQLKEMEKLNQLKDNFLSTVSHELRSPVCNMKMAIQMLEVASRQEPLTSENATAATDGQHRFSRYLQILNSECDREINLINDLLDLQRLESKLQPFSPGAIELPLWLTQLVKPFQERAQQRHQQLRLDLPAQLPILVSDPDHLERVFSELLNNACKYTPPGEQITVTAQADAGTVQIRVCNSGVEIPPREQTRIFDKFYRVAHADRWRQGGTGLGLALVKKLTELCGGRVWVEGTDGHTCFVVELPTRNLKERTPSL
jgi:PAS domain S-box-containing protein